MGLPVSAATIDLAVPGAPGAGIAAQQPVGEFSVFLHLHMGVNGEGQPPGPGGGHAPGQAPGLARLVVPADPEADADDPGTSGVAPEVALLAAPNLLASLAGALPAAPVGAGNANAAAAVELAPREEARTDAPAGLAGGDAVHNATPADPLLGALPVSSAPAAEVSAAGAAALGDEPAGATPGAGELFKEDVEAPGADVPSANEVPGDATDAEPGTATPGPEGEGLPAPGRHVGQSNRSASLPGDAGRRAVEALQRIAARHAEQGKAPPGNGAGGNGMPAIAASVVRTDGNAETTAPTQAEGDAPPAVSEAELAPTSLVTTVTTSSQPVDAPAGANGPASPPPAIPFSPGDQVGRAVIERISDGGGEVRIRLDPPELGEVAIRVHIENQHVRVDIRVERPEALQLLRNGQLDLTSLLGDRGLTLSDLFTTLDQGHARWAGGDQPGQAAPRSADGFASLLGWDEPGQAIVQHRKLQGAYNPDGAHLYRV